MVEFSAIFSQGVDGSTQAVGIGEADLFHGSFFGFGDPSNPDELAVMYATQGTANWISSSSWNGYTGDPDTSCSDRLDITKLNTYRIQGSGFGSGTYTWEIECPSTGEWVVAHKLRYGNTATVPVSDLDPHPLVARVHNHSNDSNISVKLARIEGYHLGREKEPIYLVRNTTGVVNQVVGTTEEILYQIKVSTSFQGLTNYVPVVGIRINRTSVGTKAVVIRTYANSTVAGECFSQLSAPTSVVETDFCTSNATSFTKGSLLGVNTMAANDGVSDDILFQDIRVNPGTKITFTAEAGGSTSDVSHMLVWGELF